MNMQTFQIMILLLDAFIKLAPWRTVTQALGRIGYGLSEGFIRGLKLATPAIAGLGLIAIASVFGPALAGYVVGVVPPHVSRGGLAFSYIVSAFYIGVALWAGVWWDRCNKQASAEA